MGVAVPAVLLGAGDALLALEVFLPFFFSVNIGPFELLPFLAILLVIAGILLLGATTGLWASAIALIVEISVIVVLFGVSVGGF